MPAVRGKRVLIFGDSLSSGESSPGDSMGRVLSATGATVHVNARIGRSANNFWGREDVIEQIGECRAFRPQVAIIQLGTNDLGLNMTVDREQMTKLRDALTIDGTVVYAFGPPTFPDQASNEQAKDVVDMMSSVFGNRFIDLRPMTRDMLTAAAGRAQDGVHFSSKGGKVLGDRMAQSFMSADSGGNASLVLALGLGILAWVMLR